MILRVAAALLAVLTPLRAQDIGELLDALAGTAATFAATAPGLAADETLDQRGRRGFIEVLKGKVPTLKNADIKLPDEFTQHNVKSAWSLGGEAGAIHESRTAMEIDGVNAADARQVRHAMSIGVTDPRRQMLEDFEQEHLEGAVTDFGPLILLFSAHHLEDYEFAIAPGAQLDAGPALVITYRQKTGGQGLTLFDQRTAEREPVEGTIWFRASDLLPLRITMKTRKMLSKSFSVATEASIDYQPSRYGLVPASVTHRQYLNSYLLVENNLHYSNYQHPGPELIP